MPDLQRPAVTLHYEDEGSGPPLLFLHGWCDSSECWAPVLEHYRARYRCLAPDMRGHGRSGRPHDHAYFLEALANDAVAVCEAAGVTSPVVVGHSFGGVLAALIAARSPGFARAVVIVDQVLDMASVVAPLRPALPMVWSLEQHMAFRRAYLEPMLTAAMPPAGRVILERTALSTPAEVALALWAPFAEATEAELNAFSAALVHGLGQQPALTIEAGERPEWHARLAREAPSVKIAVIPAGHWLHLEQPTLFYRTLDAVLASL